MGRSLNPYHLHLVSPLLKVCVFKKFAHYMILGVYTVMVLGGLVEGLGCLNALHDGYANNSLFYILLSGRAN